MYPYRKISIEANEYNKIDRWAKIKSKSEEIARVAQIALNLDSSTEEARLVEEIVLNLLREIRILREEQNREPLSRANSAPSSSTPSLTPSSTTTTTTTTTTSFRGSGSIDSSDYIDLDDDNIRYDKDNPSLATSASAPPLPHSRPIATPYSPSMKLRAQRSSSAPNSAPNSPPATILSDQYNTQFAQPFPPTIWQLSNPYLPQGPTLQPSTQYPKFAQSATTSSFPFQPQHHSSQPLATIPPLPPPLPPSQNAELLPSSPPPPGLPQPQKQKKRKSEKKPP